ncbi:MAG TPA: fatty acid--CoA ligase family protein [Opitutaceae bacterium]|jgi:acyl-CoA synthetase (AMP-forming)/AMP-acid ligase II|nr:fatty acid--CoA ligase family protein [Opitutaceae bacterium]
MNDEPIHLAVENIVPLARQRAGCELWLDDFGARSWPKFGAAVETARRQCIDAGVSPGSVVVTPGEASFESLPWLFGAAAVGAVVAPLRSERAGETQVWKNSIAIGWQVQDGRLVRVGEGTASAMAAPLFDQLRARNHPGLILATGGTTGTPKLVLHDLAALLATVPIRTGRARRTLPLMRFDHIGGLDMAWRALAGRQVLVAPPTELTPEAVATTIARHRVEVMPATPSFLNLLLMAEIHRTHDLGSLRVVPYGAEPMPAGLLERLRTALPKVEFIQRFGTSETGALPVRNIGDGLVLREGQAGFAWKVVDDELWIQSPSRALGYLSGNAGGFDVSGWFRTGDLAERLADGTVRVLGRREQLINVGGEKVLPGEVESVLLTHPLVADCRVSPEPNAVLGQVVAAEIVWRGPERDAVTVKRLLHAFVSGLISRQKLPVVIRLVEAIDSTRNLKKFRTVHP